MNKKTLLKKGIVITIILIFFGASIAPNIGGNIQEVKQKSNYIKEQEYYSSLIPTQTPTTSNLMTINEDIIINGDGTCIIDMDIIYPNSPLSLMYRDILNYSGDDITEPNSKDIELTVTVDDTITLGANVSHTEYYVTPSTTNVRDQLINGVIEEHYYSFGIELNPLLFVAKTWGTGGDCIIEIQAFGDYQQLGTDELLIGPVDIERSFDRMAFLFSKINFIQDMLNSSAFSGYAGFKSVWDTTISTPDGINNQRELQGERWYQNFGNLSYILADLVVRTPTTLELTETLYVSRFPVNVTPDELVANQFLCFKVFRIAYGSASFKEDSLFDACSTLYTIKENSGSRGGGFDPTWSIDLINEDYNLTISKFNGLVDITINMHHELTLSGHLSWKFKWFRLKKFQTWTKLSTDIDIEFIVDIGGQKDWDYDQLFFEREKEYFFWVGYVPVWMKLKFAAEARLSIDVEAQVIVTYPAHIDGFVKAGVGWKRGRGWYKIRSADMSVDIEPPEYTTSFEVIITPSIGFRISLIFYETAGPFIELEPYAQLTIYPTAGEGSRWHFEVGININAGIDFEDWLEDLLDLNDWSWTLYNYVFYECWECVPPEEYDIAVIDFDSPVKAFVTEPINLTVDILNKGLQTVDVNVSVFEEGSLIGYQTVSSLRKGKTNTTVYAWDTSSVSQTEHDHEFTVTATIIDHDDANPGDNGDVNYTHFEVQDVGISMVDVPFYEQIVPRGTPVHITVRVYNYGTDPVASVPVYVYYGASQTPLGPVWCDYTSVAIDIAQGSYEDIQFTWDTKHVNSGIYQLSAIVEDLDYEVDYGNELYDDTVQIEYVPNDLPFVPVLNFPPNDGIDIQVYIALQWTGGDPDPGDTVTYDVYLSVHDNPVIISIDEEETEYDPIGWLDFETTYYWRIVARDRFCEERSSATYSFTTASGSAQMCGDADGNMMINLMDVIFLIDYLFIPGNPAPEPLCRGDANGDDILNISDIAYLINYVFIPEAPPPVDDCCI